MLLWAVLLGVFMHGGAEVTSIIVARMNLSSEEAQEYYAYCHIVAALARVLIVSGILIAVWPHLQ
jgi:hypothetical protein